MTTVTAIAAATTVVLNARLSSFYGGDARVHSLVWGTLLEEETLDRDHFTLQSAPRRG